MQLSFVSRLPFRFARKTSLTLILTLFFLISSNKYLIYALDADSIAYEDHNHPRPLALGQQQDHFRMLELMPEEEQQSYEPTFAGLLRSIIGRVPPEPNLLVNNVPKISNISGGDPQYWKLRNDTLWGPQSPIPSVLPLSLTIRGLGEKPIRNGEAKADESRDYSKRQVDGKNNRTLYITLSICQQPSPNKSNNSGGAPPPLQLYISKSSNNPHPNRTTTEILFTMNGGFGNTSFEASGDVFFTVLADESPDFTGVYNYQLTVSIDAPYTSYGGNVSLTFLDSDSNSTLLASHNFSALTDSSTDEWKHLMNARPPYSIFVFNQDNPTVRGIENSTCALRQHAEILGNFLNENTANVETSMTSSSGGTPKQYFYVKGLKANTTYNALMAIDGNSTGVAGGVVKGGGTVFKAISFTTKSENNCAIIYNLSFCTDTAYAVPSNPNTFPDRAALATLYDTSARALYQPFNFSLQQIPCETTPSAQYSLARNCSDCARDYRAWLCAVTIPRCHDVSSTLHWLQPRSLNQSFTNGTMSVMGNANNEQLFINANLSSRTPLIESTIVPGPWKEVLPCTDVCYRLVQSCPAALGFACPADYRLKWSYGTRAGGEGPLDITCNDPTVLWKKSAAGRIWVTSNALNAMIISGVWALCWILWV